MTTDINKLPQLVLPNTEGAPNPLFPEYLATDGTWKPMVTAPAFPWRNFHELMMPGHKHRYFVGIVPGTTNGVFRVKR